jgi:hypothetical protein
MSLHVEISESAFRQRFAQAAKTFPLTLDRFVQRAANEFAKAESWKYRKGSQRWFNSVHALKVAQADYAVLPTARYAAAVNNGGRPHWAPITPLKDWLRVIHRVAIRKNSTGAPVVCSALSRRTAPWRIRLSNGRAQKWMIV